MSKNEVASFHESFQRDDEEKTGSSNRNFGLTIAAFFLLIFLLKWKKTGVPHWSAALVALFFGGSALFAPKGLTVLNRAWTKFGLLLHKVVSPVAMGLIFFVVLTPMALLARLMGKDPMRRKWEPNANSYWITRSSEVLSTMRDQF